MAFGIVVFSFTSWADGLILIPGLFVGVFLQQSKALGEVASLYCT